MNGQGRPALGFGFGVKGRMSSHQSRVVNHPTPQQLLMPGDPEEIYFWKVRDAVDKNADHPNGACDVDILGHTGQMKFKDHR